MPVTRVILYKNGVGYFEHLGHVRDNQDVSISFTSGQLNDVLKSLTVLDLNGGRIAGVAYGSAAPMDRQMEDLRLPLGDKPTLTEFLGALRGTRIEVRNGTASITGRLLSVERKTRMGGAATLEVDYVSVLTDSGEVRTTELGPSFTVRLLEQGLAGKVDHFLDLISKARDADVRRMVISTTGTGERSLFVSYVSEAPVWKTTYRIVLSGKSQKSPLLQGWAIVDNTVGQDWEKVSLSLVAGAPHSFIQNLSQPYYARRPVVGLPESVNFSPQTHEATLIPGGGALRGVIGDSSGAGIFQAKVRLFDGGNSMVAETTTRPSGEYEFATLPDGPFRMEVEASGFQKTVITDMVASGQQIRRDLRLQLGSTSQTVNLAANPNRVTVQSMTAEVRSGARSVGSGRGLGAGSGGNVFRARTSGGGSGRGQGVGPDAMGIDEARALAASAASGETLGDVFEYKVKEPITIRRNQSALVPIVQTSIGSEKISLWNESSGMPKPQRALWLTNSSGLTLDGGSFTVLEDEAFAGEGLFDPIRPDEKRIVSYATDLALTVRASQDTERQNVTRVRVSKGVITTERVSLEKKTYTFRNEDAAPRTVLVEHAVRAGYQLRSAVQPIETSSGWMRFKVQVEPKQTASLTVEEAKPLFATYALSTLSSDQIALFVRERSIDKKLEEALRKVLAQKDVISDLESQQSARESEQEKIFDDQQRLRENMKALKGSAEERALLQRYTQQLGKQENRLEELKKESESLDEKQNNAKEQLDRMIEELSFDVKL